MPIVFRAYIVEAALDTERRLSLQKVQQITS
jgi:hypothetical protein